MRNLAPTLHRSIALTLPVLLAACGAPAADPAAEPAATSGNPTPGAGDPAPAATPAPDPDVIASPGELAGEYRIAAVDGGDIDLPHGISASITDSEIRYTSQCVTGTWRYRFEGQALVLEPVREPVCDRGRYPEEEAIQAAFEAARQVRRTPANGIEFSGGGRSVLLFSQ